MRVPNDRLARIDSLCAASMPSIPAASVRAQITKFGSRRAETAARSRRTMSSAEFVDAASSDLVDVAVHGMTHTCFPCLSPERLADELSTARSMLTAMVGHDVNEVAYPYGHHDSRVREAVRAAGFTTGYTFLNGRVMHEYDPLRLPRITMHDGLTAPLLAHQVSRRATDWAANQQQSVHPHAAPKGER